MLTLASDTHEAAPRSLFWAAIGLDELLEVDLEFPFNLTGNLTMVFNTSIILHTQIVVHKLGGATEQELLLVLSCVYDVLEEVDRSLFKKISSMPGHPLYPSVPKTKESSVHLRILSSQLPSVNT